MLEDFLTKLAGETGLAYRGRRPYVRSVLSDAFGPDRAQSVLARINPLSLERPIEFARLDGCRDRVGRGQ